MTVTAANRQPITSSHANMLCGAMCMDNVYASMRCQRCLWRHPLQKHRKPSSGTSLWENVYKDEYKTRLSSFRCSRHHKIILIIILMFTILQISFWGSNPPRSPLPSMKGKHNNEQMPSRLWYHYNQMASKFLSLLFISPQSMLINEQGSGTKFSLFPSFAIISMQSSILLSWLVFVTVISSIVNIWS